MTILQWMAQTCVDVAVFASILRGDHRSYVCSAQRREEAELSVEPGNVLWVGHHLTTSSRITRSTPQYKLSNNEHRPIHFRAKWLTAANNNKL